LRCPPGAGGKVVLVGLRGHLAPPWLVAVRLSATRSRQHGSHRWAEQAVVASRSAGGPTERDATRDNARSSWSVAAVHPSTAPPACRRRRSRPPRWLGAGTGLACGAARGNPAPARGPAGCLLDGLPPGRHPRQGRCAVLRTGLRPPLTRPSSRRPGETRSPGAGEEQRPTSRQDQEVRS
jgi:hypothetical protein